MPKKISYFLHDFSPDREALSKEVQTLCSGLNRVDGYQTVVHDISTCAWKVRLSSARISYPKWLWPIGYFVTKHLQHRSDLIHIVGSITGRIYSRLLERRPAVLTNASAIMINRLKECDNYWRKLDLIAVECNRDKELLLQHGVPAERLQVIYPGVKIPKSAPPLKNKKFNILFASAPISSSADECVAKGVDLILEAARELQDCHFTLLWRGRHLDKAKRKIQQSATGNVTLHNEIIADMMQFYTQFHTVLLAPTHPEACKPCPHSLIEALAAGRPVIASRHIGIADLIDNEQCGVSCNADKESLLREIDRLRTSYERYQKQCLPTALRYFSCEAFVRNYREIYSRLLADY